MLSTLSELYIFSFLSLLALAVGEENYGSSESSSISGNIEFFILSFVFRVFYSKSVNRFASLSQLPRNPNFSDTLQFKPFNISFWVTRSSINIFISFDSFLFVYL